MNNYLLLILLLLPFASSHNIEHNDHHHHHHYLHHNHNHHHNHDHDHHHHHHHDEDHRGLNNNGIVKGRCGMHSTTVAEKEESNRYVNSWKESNNNGIIGRNNINIPTHFHVISTSNGSHGGLTQTDVTNSLNALNNGFAGTGIQFYQEGVTFSNNDDWFYAGSDSNDEINFKSSLRQGGVSTLNVYFNNADGYLGYAEFPWYYSCSNSYNDGVVIDYTTVPGGSNTDYNMGATLTHEVGHWLGLFHVFEGSTCSSDGDEVSDTPYQRTASRGCPTAQDSCPSSPGLDSTNNFMDYSDDRCLTTFTPGQADRMAAYWDWRINQPDCSTLVPGVCFSPNVQVKVLNNDRNDDGSSSSSSKGIGTVTTTTMTMKDIKVGDKVLTASGEYKTIYTISHFHQSKPTKYLQIHTMEDHQVPLEITPSHMIFMHGSTIPIPASDVRINDVIQSITGPKKVINITTTIINGLYNPITTDGTIVVGTNNLIASTYTTFTGTSHVFMEIQFGQKNYNNNNKKWKILSFQTIAELAYTPYREMCMIISLDLCNQHNELASVNQIMKTIYNTIWSKQHHPLFQVALLFAYLIIFGSIYVVTFWFFKLPSLILLLLLVTTILRHRQHYFDKKRKTKKQSVFNEKDKTKINENELKNWGGCWPLFSNNVCPLGHTY